MDNASIFEGVVKDIRAERCRQIHEEGWEEEHDDNHTRGELADAAACYADTVTTRHPPSRWPWERQWWKPSGNRRRDLIKAAALLVAEIERIDRAAVREMEEENQ